MLAVSCNQEEDDLFDKQAAQRMNETVELVTSTLEDAEYGWMVEFYPNHSGQMGGVPMVALFKDGKATIYTTDIEIGTEPVTSLYQVKGEQECLLTFDSYNKLFHYYSEPQGSDAPFGLESDYEFAYKSMSDDGNTITFKGKRYGQPFILRRMDGTLSPEQYVEKINVINNKMFYEPRGLAIINGMEYDVNFYDGVFKYSELTTEIEDGEEVTKKVTSKFAAIPTLTGMHFQQPLSFGGKTVQDLYYNEQTDELSTEDGSFVIPNVLPTGYRRYDELPGTYIMKDADGENMSVTVRANGDGKSYTINGMTGSGLAVTADFNVANGSLEIHPQYLGRYGSYHSWLMAESATAVTWGTSAKIEGQNDADGNITFDGNGTYVTLIEYACTAKEYADAGSDFSEWVLGYLTMYPEPIVFTRK